MHIKLAGNRPEGNHGEDVKECWCYLDGRRHGAARSVGDVLRDLHAQATAVTSRG